MQWFLEIMAKTFQYTVVFDRDEDGVIIATVPALQGCHSFGHTLAEAEENIAEAILCCLEGLQEIGEEIPVEETLPTPITKAIQVSLAAV